MAKTIEMDEKMKKSVDHYETLKVNYGGQERVIRPVTQGKSTANNEVVRAYEVSKKKDGKTEHTNDYKLYDLKKMKDVKTQDTSYIPGQQKKDDKKDKGMKQTYASNVKPK